MLTTFSRLLPTSATLRPRLAATFIICCTRWIFEENVATIMRLLPALRKSVSNDSPTFLSLSVKPGRSALVESDIRQRTPSCPISASLPRSIMPPSIGVVSILKSPVWTIVPPSQRIASPSASGMEWLTWIASTVKPPRVITSPGLMTLSDAELSSPCSRSFP